MKLFFCILFGVWMVWEFFDKYNYNVILYEKIKIFIYIFKIVSYKVDVEIFGLLNEIINRSILRCIINIVYSNLIGCRIFIC